MTHLSFAIHYEGDHWICRQDDRIIYPSINYEGMKPENKFEADPAYFLEKTTIWDFMSFFDQYKFTKKIPLSIKNEFRAFLGMKPAKSTKWSN